MTEIEPPRTGDHAAWAALYRAYAEFYRVPMTEDVLRTVWGWIHDPDHEVEALVARQDGGGEARLVGLAHFRPFARPLRGQVGTYLDDLFVAPAARGVPPYIERVCTTMSLSVQ